MFFSFCYLSSVVPVCTSSTQSGQTLYIDTSAVPILGVEQTCQCDIQFTFNATEVTVHYLSPGYTSCGLKFSFTTTSFLCTTGLFRTESYFEEITFIRDANSDATACLVIYLGKLFLTIIFSKRIYIVSTLNNIWALSRVKLSSGVCKQHKCRPASASTQSDQCLCYSLFGKCHM